MKGWPFWLAPFKRCLRSIQERNAQWWSFKRVANTSQTPSFFLHCKYWLTESWKLAISPTSRSERRANNAANGRNEEIWLVRSCLTFAPSSDDVCVKRDDSQWSFSGWTMEPVQLFGFLWEHCAKLSLESYYFWLIESARSGFAGWKQIDLFPAQWIVKMWFVLYTNCKKKHIFYPEMFSNYKN
jgi:hypothetical protein